MVSGISERLDWAATRVLVTGATGFIGHHLIHRLLGEGATLFAGGRAGGRLNSEERRTVSDGVNDETDASLSWLVFDVRDPAAVRAAVQAADPEVIFHLAAVGVTNPRVAPADAVAVNVGGTLNLLEVARERGLRRFVLVGTSYEYGARQAREGLDPFNIYGASKVAAWAFGRVYWRVYGLPVVTVRPFQVYGPGQPAHTLLPAAIRAALTGADFPTTPGEQMRDFIYVEDVVAGMLAAAESPAAIGHSLDLGTGCAHTVREVVHRVWKMTGAAGRILLGALPYRPGEVMHLVADADETFHRTGWRAQVALDTGLQRTIAWFHEKDSCSLFQ